VLRLVRERVPAGFEKTADEPELAKKIAELTALLPEDVRNTPGMSVETLHGLVDDLIRVGRAYLSRFPEGASYREVLYPVARVLILNYSRALLAESQRLERETGRTPDLPTMDRVRKDYFVEVIHIIDEGIAAFTEGKQYCEFQKLRGISTFFANRYAESAEAYRIVLAHCPDDPKTPESLLALLNAYLHDKKYDDAVLTADQFITRFPRDDLLPHAYQLKAKTLTEAGRPEDALEWWRSILDLLRIGASGVTTEIGGEPHTWAGEAQAAFQRYLDEGRFMIGFLLFVLDRYEEAKTSLAETLVELSQLEAQGKIDPRSKVFLDRTRKMHEVLVASVRSPAPDLSIGSWLDDVPLDPRAERGNVVVLLFAPFEQPRYEDIQGTLQKYYAELWAEGLRVGWICDPKGFADIPSKLARVGAQRQRLGLAYPIGIETEPQWPNFTRYQASVGGAAIVVIDRGGNVAWYDQDPTYRTERLLRGVIDRLLAEPKPGAKPAGG